MTSDYKTMEEKPMIQDGQVVGAAPAVYVLAQSQRPALGVGGLPRAIPAFFGRAETNIRTPYFGCFNWAPGPNVPDHWLDGGDGWVTRYFADIESFDAVNRKNGKHRCQVPLQPDGRHCNHVVENDGCCNDSICWMPYSRAPGQMAAHLATHGIVAPQKRRWASDLFDTEGCLDVWFCTPCAGSRQMMAQSGYADEFNVWFCLFFVFMGIRVRRVGRHAIIYYIPPHTLAAILTRYNMVALNNIDEHCCKTLAIIWCCAPCSLAQTYRELSASGVWPGGICNPAPPAYALQPPGSANIPQ